MSASDLRRLEIPPPPPPPSKLLPTARTACSRYPQTGALLRRAPGGRTASPSRNIAEETPAFAAATAPMGWSAAWASRVRWVPATSRAGGHGMQSTRSRLRPIVRGVWLPAQRKERERGAGGEGELGPGAASTKKKTNSGSDLRKGKKKKRGNKNSQPDSYFAAGKGARRPPRSEFQSLSLSLSLSLM